MGYTGQNITGCNSPSTGDTNYTTTLDTSFQKVDEHDHTSGKGDQIPTAGIEDLAITTGKIDSLAVTTAKIAANAVTLAKLASDVLPPGVMMQYGGSSAPTGWLFCDGSAVSTTTYAALFAVLGTTFNTGGEAGGTFRLPDMRGRAPIGVGTGSGLTARALGASGGNETHTLSTAETPSHTHSFSATSSGQSQSHTHDMTHSHNIGNQSGNSGSNAQSDWIAKGIVSNAFGVATTLSQSATTTGAASVDHTHTVSGTTGSAGSGGSHNNMQPFLVVNFIIKT